jgi:hypothetical protein
MEDAEKLEETRPDDTRGLAGEDAPADEELSSEGPEQPEDGAGDSDGQDG